MNPSPSGWLTSVNADTGAVRWKFHAPAPVVSGITPTAGGITFFGDVAGTLYALKSSDGSVLFSTPTGGGHINVTCFPARGDILQLLRVEHPTTGGASVPVEHIRARKPERIELPQGEKFARTVVAPHVSLTVRLAVRVLLLPCVDRSTRHAHEFTFEHRFGVALTRRVPRLTLTLAGPVAQKPVHLRKAGCLGAKPQLPLASTAANTTRAMVRMRTTSACGVHVTVAAMKIRDSGMPDEGTWDGFFDPGLTLRQLRFASNDEDVADLGCGYGTFSIAAARLTSGTVHAFDIEHEMVLATQSRAQREGLRNITTLERDS